MCSVKELDKDASLALARLFGCQGEACLWMQATKSVHFSDISAASLAPRLSSMRDTKAVCAERHADRRREAERFTGN